MAAAYRLRETPLKPEVDWSVDGEDLVRRSGLQETRWPLANLLRLTLARRPNRYGPDARFAELRFRGPLRQSRIAISSRGWLGIGRPVDMTRQFSPFVRTLTAAAAEAAPAARFELRGAPLGRSALYWVAGLLGLGVLAMVGVALSAGALGMGVDLSARLLFVLILLFAVAPWLPGGRGRTFDPLAPPSDFVPPG